MLVVTPNYRGLVMDSATTDAFRRRLLETAKAIPGVQYATRVNGLPFLTNTFDLHVPGIDSVARLGRFNYQCATPDYFNTVDTRIMRGRSFTTADRDASSLVAVVSESMARALWPAQDPIGKCIRFGADTTPCISVIGVAEDAVQYSSQTMSISCTICRTINHRFVRRIDSFCVCRAAMRRARWNACAARCSR